MRQVNKTVLSGVDTGSVDGIQIDSNQLISASFQAVFGDTSAAGTVKIQMSNDVAPAQVTSTFVVTNWVDIPSASSAITAGVGAPIILTQVCARWLRAVYTRSSGGSTTVIVNMFGLSV